GQGGVRAPVSFLLDDPVRGEGHVEVQRQAIERGPAREQVVALTEAVLAAALVLLPVRSVLVGVRVGRLLAFAVGEEPARLLEAARLEIERDGAHLLGARAVGREERIPRQTHGAGVRGRREERGGEEEERRDGAPEAALHESLPADALADAAASGRLAARDPDRR